MKFKDFLEKVDNNEFIEVVITIDGLEFCKKGTVKAFHKTDKLDDMGIIHFGVTYIDEDGFLQIKLARPQAKLEENN